MARGALYPPRLPRPAHRPAAAGRPVSRPPAPSATYDKLYLITKHEHYYEKTGWIFFEQIPTGNGETERVYYHPLR